MLITNKLFPLSINLASRLGFKQPKLAEEAITKFCQRWKIEEFYLFGSVLREDFSEKSDIDVMVKFSPDARLGFKFVTLCEELENLFKRNVDVITKKGIQKTDNWIVQENILNNTKLIYAQKQR